MTEDQIKSLSELKKLYDSGIINDREFAEQKKSVLSDTNGSEQNENMGDIYNSNVENYFSDEYTDHNSQKKTTWIIIGIVAVISIIAIIMVTKNNHSSSYDSYDESVYDVDTEETCVEVEAGEEYYVPDSIDDYGYY